MNALVQRRLDADDRVWRDRAPMACDRCAFVGFVPAERGGAPCPWCGHGRLAPSGAFVAVAEPELQLPFLADVATVRVALDGLRRRVWLADPGFDPARLAASVERIWVPAWLVDATVSGHWSAEVGFDVEVTSSEEHLEHGRWVSRPVTRTKVRWEPRIGEVKRRYDNASAAACRALAEIEARVGPFDLASASPLAADPGTGFVLAPDVSPEEAWAAACERIGHEVAADCARATGAAHVRGAKVDADHEDVHATWVLLPVGSVAWTDERGGRHVVWIHGVTGRADGRVSASFRRATTWAVGLGVLGVGVLALALLTGLLGAVLLPLLAFAPVLAIVGVALCVAAVVPLVYAGVNGPSSVSAAGSRRL